MSSDKWKSRLQSSSLPLEFEAAKVLVAKDFVTVGDYTYGRDDAGVVKEFSVDIEAVGFSPFNDIEDFTSHVSLLVECKHRVPNIKWLFVPDPNDPELSPIKLGQTVRVVDQFSSYAIAKNSTTNFDEKVPRCYKGVEINLSTGDVFDKELKHGVSQLQYALPRLFTQMVLREVDDDRQNELPFAFFPILLTTAEIYVAESDLTMDELERANSITDIASLVPYLIFYQDFGPDFERHCAKECAQLSDLEDLERINNLIKKLKINSSDPKRVEFVSSIGKGLATADSDYLSEYFTQFVVCSYANFPTLIDTLKNVITDTMASRTKL